MKRALVIGRSASVNEDLLLFPEIHYDEILVVGKMLTIFPGSVDHAVSFHSDLFSRWAAIRASKGLSPVRCYWGATFRGKPMYAGGSLPPGPLKRVAQVGGSSGFMAIQVAINELFCKQVVLAGMPMEASASHLPETLSSSEAPGAPWDEADRYWETWLEHIDWLRNHVRSVSGRTRDALGSPTQEWLNGSAP